MTDKYRETKFNTAYSSGAINVLTRLYKFYVKDCIKNMEPIEHISKFYFRMLREGDMAKSRIFERYLAELSQSDKVLIKPTDDDSTSNKR